MTKSLNVATMMLSAAATLSSLPAASAQDLAPIELPNNVRYTLVGDSLHQALPGCGNVYSYRWYKNGTLTTVITPDYTIEPYTSTVGATYTYQRTALCNGCPPLHRSRMQPIWITNPIDTLVFDCRKTKVSGSYFKYANAQQASNCVSLSVDNQSPQSVSWQAETGSVNGLVFKGSGTLVPGQNTIQLYASGFPLITGLNHFDLKLNAGKIYVKNPCGFDVYVTIPKISISIVSNTGGAWCQSCPNAAIPKMIANKDFNHFFSDPSYSKVYNLSYANGVSTIPKADILFWGYDERFKKEHRDKVARYVKNGLPTILCIGTENYVSAAEYEAWIRGNFGDSRLRVTDKNASSSAGVPFVAGSPVVAGPYMNLVGKKLFPDAKGNIDFTNVDGNRWWIIAEQTIGGTRYARAIMHKQYPLILIGDGGGLSGGYGYTNADAQPAAVDTYGRPQPRITSYYPSPGSYTGHFLLNVLLWGIGQHTGK